MPDRALLLSIRPKYANMIFDGTKTVELRRVKPRITTGDLVLVYVSSPTKALLGAFQVAKVISSEPPDLWNKVKGKAGLNREAFDEYFKGAKQAYGIFLEQKWKLDKPLKLESLRKSKANFRPPQSYHYLTRLQASLLGCEEFFSAGYRANSNPKIRRFTQ